MITTKTVFVLGAGSSSDYGLPLGSSLVGDIINSIKTEVIGLEIVSATGQNHTTFHTLANQLTESRLDSIDSWLGRRENFLAAGKIAICRSIARFEKEDKLHNGWYRTLWQRLVDGIPNANYLTQANRVSFVTFNYDRSLEEFLFQATLGTFGCSEEEAARTISEFPIIHVHGQAGFLPWQGKDAKKSRPYRAASMHGLDSWKEAASIASLIKVVHENERQKCADAAGVLEEADHVYFMGFGYDDRNLKKISFHGSNGPREKVVGTYFRGTVRQQGAIQNEGSNGWGARIKLELITSLSEFFNTHVNVS